MHKKQKSNKRSAQSWILAASSLVFGQGIVQQEC
jgi:hypothetical protein